MFNINFVDDWIRTADLWSWKKPLYQVSQWATITAQDTTKFNWTKRPFLTLPFRNVCLGSNAVEWFNQDAYCQFSANLMLYPTSERTILNWVNFEASESFIVKMGHTDLFFLYFSSFTIFTTNKCEKCPSSTYYTVMGSNSRLSEHQSPTFTTRPGLPPWIFHWYQIPTLTMLIKISIFRRRRRLKENLRSH